MTDREARPIVFRTWAGIILFSAVVVRWPDIMVPLCACLLGVVILTLWPVLTYLSYRSRRTIKPRRRIMINKKAALYTFLTWAGFAMFMAAILLSPKIVGTIAVVMLIAILLAFVVWCTYRGFCDQERRAK